MIYKKNPEIQFSKNDSFFLQKSIQVGFVTFTVLLLPFFSTRAAKATYLKDQTVSVSTNSAHSTKEQKAVENNLKQKTSKSLNSKETSPNNIKQTISTELSDQKISRTKNLIRVLKSTPKNLILWIRNNPIPTIGWTVTFLKAWKLSKEVNILQQTVRSLEQDLQQTRIREGVHHASSEFYYHKYQEVCNDPRFNLPQNISESQ